MEAVTFLPSRLSLCLLILDGRLLRLSQLLAWQGRLQQEAP